jgi:transposase
VLVSNTAVKRNRELLDGRWDKHDVKDSANVADLISQGKCLFYDYPSLVIRELRNLISLKRRLKKEEQGYRVRIRNHLLAQYFPELDRYFGSKESLGVVKWCVIPTVMKGLSFEEFVRLVTSGRIRSDQERRLRRIWEHAVFSIGCEAGEAVAFEAKVLVERVREIREVIKTTEAKIEERCKECAEYEYLLTIPGFGPDVSSKVLGAIGDPHRFTTSREVLKLAGLDLSADRSGKTADKAIPVLSKKGKADLRYALYQAAFIASTRNRYFIIYQRDAEDHGRKSVGESVSAEG